MNVESQGPNEAYQKAAETLVVPVSGQLEDLDDFKFVSREKLRGWNMGTGLAVTDWLKSVGIEAEPMRLG